MLILDLLIVLHLFEFVLVCVTVCMEILKTQVQYIFVCTALAAF